jgi:hypothetical protein
VLQILTEDAWQRIPVQHSGLRRPHHAGHQGGSTALARQANHRRRDERVCDQGLLDLRRFDALPPQLELLTVEHILRKILEAPAGRRSQVLGTIGLPIPPYDYVGEAPPAEGIIGMIEEEYDDDDKA